MIEKLVRKCEYCSNPATRVTGMYSLNFEHLGFWTKFSRKLKRGEFMKKCICDKHYFEFEHGLVTIVCDHCSRDTILSADDYYNMLRVFCSHCGKMITYNVEND